MTDLQYHPPTSDPFIPGECSSEAQGLSPAFFSGGTILVFLCGLLGAWFCVMPLVNLFVFDEVYGAILYEHHARKLSFEDREHLGKQLRYEEYLIRANRPRPQPDIYKYLTEKTEGSRLNLFAVGEIIRGVTEAFEQELPAELTRERRWALLQSGNRFLTGLFSLFAFAIIAPLLRRFQTLRWMQVSLLYIQSAAAFLAMAIFMVVHMAYPALRALFLPSYWVGLAALGGIWLGSQESYRARPDTKGLLYGILFTLILGLATIWPLV